MIRRWSYINSLNSNLFINNTPSINPVINVLRIVSFKSTTYYWENLYFDNISFLTRRSYYRRRHINSFSIYQNILGIWSRDYCFFRKYSRPLFGLGFFKYNYILQNIFIAKNKDISDLIGFNSFKLTFLTNSIYRYCNKVFTNILPSLLIYKGPYLYTSSPDRLIRQSLQNTALDEEPLTLLTPKGILKPSIKINWLTSITFFFDSILSLYLSYVVLYYKSIIYLTKLNVT